MVDHITGPARAYELDESRAAKDANAQILINGPCVQGLPECPGQLCSCQSKLPGISVCVYDDTGMAVF